MKNYKNDGKFDLEERSEKFAKDCRDFVKNLPRTISNIEYGKQLVRSAGSQAANYIEANESLSKKDFVYRLRISRKETKESCMWIRLCEPIKKERKKTEGLLDEEAIQLRKIYNAIIEKSS